MKKLFNNLPPTRSGSILRVSSRTLRNYQIFWSQICQKVQKKNKFQLSTLDLCFSLPLFLPFVCHSLCIRLTKKISTINFFFLLNKIEEKEKASRKSHKRKTFLLLSVQMKSIERARRKKDSIGFVYIKNPINKNLFLWW